MKKKFYNGVASMVPPCSTITSDQRLRLWVEVPDDCPQDILRSQTEHYLRVYENIITG